MSLLKVDEIQKLNGDDFFGDAVRNLPTLVSAVAATNLVVGDAINLAERIGGSGGGAMWDVVLSSGVTENTFNIVQCTGVPTLSLVLRIDGSINIRQLGAIGVAGTDDTLSIQFAMDSDYDVYLPAGGYPVSDLVLRKSKSMTWDEGAKLQPFGQTGTFVFKIDGSINPDEEDAIRVNSNRIYIDGRSRQFPHQGLQLKRLLRSEFGEVTLNRVKSTGLNFVHSVKETTFDVIRAVDCGSSASASSFNPAIDMTENGDAEDAHNNIFVNSVFCVYSRGPDIVIDSFPGRANNPRKIQFGKFFIHGHIEASDPVGDPLTTAEKDDRKQIIIGTAEQIHFGVGSLAFAANNAYSVHVTAGANGDTSRRSVHFDHLIMNNRFNFLGANSQYHGIHCQDGLLSIKGAEIGDGYTGFDAVKSLTGSECIINPFDFSVLTGAVDIADTQTMFVRNLDLDMGQGDIQNLRTLQAGASAMQFREGQSGSDKLAMEVRNSTNAVQAKVVQQTFIEQKTLALPTAANMILDGVASATAYDGTNLRWFDGTVWKTVTTT